jgi:peptidyl-prolyl cis-trans isomerase D
MAAETYIHNLNDAFVASTSDSLFVASNSDEPMDNSFHKKGTLSPFIDSAMFNNATGKVVGPYTESNGVHLAKLAEIKMIPDSAKARHILFKTEKPEDSTTVKTKADSIFNLIKKGAKFETFVSLSQDPGSAAKGGDLGWFKSGAMVPEFNDYCFNNKKGSLGLVKTQFGYHIIEVMDVASASKQVKVAVVTRKIEPSTKTFQSWFSKANEFAGKNNTADAFKKAAKEQNLNIRTAERLTENESI